TRRAFLERAAAIAPALWLSRSASASTQAPRVARFPSDPFTLGVASGDPAPDGVVLWTRLAPQPLHPDGGMPPHNVDVEWEVADDEGMQHIVERGTADATPHLAHSVHAEPQELQPDRWYWYRFRAGEAESCVGRTRTLPAPDATVEKLRLAFASCQHWESGLYT